VSTSSRRRGEDALGRLFALPGPLRITYGTAQPRSALTANSIVLIACSPWVPPAALIRPMTSSCKNGGSREPSACSQSSAFLKAPEIVPWYIGLLHSIPLAP
jgi:hypothetical protein